MLESTSSKLRAIRINKKPISEYSPTAPKLAPPLLPLREIESISKAFIRLVNAPVRKYVTDEHSRNV